MTDCQGVSTKMHSTGNDSAESCRVHMNEFTMQKRGRRHSLKGATCTSPRIVTKNNFENGKAFPLSCGCSENTSWLFTKAVHCSYEVILSILMSIFYTCKQHRVFFHNMWVILKRKSGLYKQSILRGQKQTERPKLSPVVDSEGS